MHVSTSNCKIIFFLRQTKANVLQKDKALIFFYRDLLDGALARDHEKSKKYGKSAMRQDRQQAKSHKQISSTLKRTHLIITKEKERKQRKIIKQLTVIEQLSEIERWKNPMRIKENKTGHEEYKTDLEHACALKHKFLTTECDKYKYI